LTRLLHQAYKGIFKAFWNNQQRGHIVGFSLGLVGLGSFGSSFAPLFAAHPAVNRIALCDTEADRVQKWAEHEALRKKFNPRDAYDSLDAISESDLDAVAIITQPWLHAPQALQAMKAGKHVYSAVPIIAVPDMDEILDYCDQLVNTCAATGRHYMLGETTIYRPQTMYCRRQAAAGAFGEFVYSEGEYYHPFDLPACDLRDVARARADSKSGREWEGIYAEKYAARGLIGTPMEYPTHSISGPMSVMQAHATKVSAHAFQGRDEFFDAKKSNVTALFSMSNGSSMRINEFRECAYAVGPFEHEIFRIWGTTGTFRENQWSDRDEWTELTIDEMRDPLPEDVYKAFEEVATHDVYGGHGGSHAYLVHEFCDAIAHERIPVINIWESARYMAAGCAAHKSALNDGEITEVCDWGDPPA